MTKMLPTVTPDPDHNTTWIQPLAIFFRLNRGGGNDNDEINEINAIYDATQNEAILEARKLITK